MEGTTPSRDPIPGANTLPPPEPSLPSRVRGFLFRVLSKAIEDNIFFMAGAITFNLLVALVPLTLLFIGISGFVLSSRFPEPGAVLLTFFLEALPQTGGDLNLISGVQDFLENLVADRRSFSLLGLLIFLWISTRLVGTLRAALREIFDFPHGRGIIYGKLFDAGMVVVAGLLFIVNMGITVILQIVEEYGINLLGLQGEGQNLIRNASAQLLAFGSIYVLFILVYRYFPPRRVPWRTALTAATFTAILFELSKFLFSWYLANVANFGSVYGSLTSAAVLFFWIYYGAVVFILGGEVAQIYTMSRVRRLHAAESPFQPPSGSSSSG